MQAREPHYFVYIFGNQPRQDVEIGIVGDLQLLSHAKAVPVSKKGVAQHAKLVYYEHYQAEEEALTRERQIKGGTIDSTYQLIESMNPNWLDLSDLFED